MCGDVCAHIEDDGRHCGGCDQRCDAGKGCVNGVCTTGEGCFDAVAPTHCGDRCVDATPNADHCGSCDNRCGSDQLCVQARCLDQEGDGTSCASPLIWDVEAEEQTAFRMDEHTTTHRFECGPLGDLPTRWFRYTATKDGDISIRAEAGADFILELFSASSCDAAVRMGCNDNADDLDPTLEDPATQGGSTYYVAVGLKSGPANASVTLRVDH